MLILIDNDIKVIVEKEKKPKMEEYFVNMDITQRNRAYI